MLLHSIATTVRVHQLSLTTQKSCRGKYEYEYSMQCARVQHMCYHWLVHKLCTFSIFTHYLHALHLLMKGMWLRVQGTCMTVTDSIAPGSPMPLSCLLCATVAEGRSLLSRRDQHPWYPCIGRGWSAGLPPQAVKAAMALRAKKLRDSGALNSK